MPRALPVGMIDNPVRGRFNAFLLEALDDYMDRKYAQVKSRLLGGAPAAVVELGPGAGANLRYLRRGTRLIAVEPNVRMHAALRRNARKHGIDLDLRGIAGEALDLEPGSVDFVFSSLVLCSVRKPSRVVEEVRRVLRPGGRFVCVEHVAAPAGTTTASVQKLLRRPWRWIFEGCDLCRDTGATLRDAGFARTEVRPFELDSPFFPIRYQIVAECVR